MNEDRVLIGEQDERQQCDAIRERAQRYAELPDEARRYRSTNEKQIRNRHRDQEDIKWLRE